MTKGHAHATAYEGSYFNKLSKLFKGLSIHMQAYQRLVNVALSPAVWCKGNKWQCSISLCVSVSSRPVFDQTPDQLWEEEAHFLGAVGWAPRPALPWGSVCLQTLCGHPHTCPSAQCAWAPAPEAGNITLIGNITPFSFHWPEFQVWIGSVNVDATICSID